MPCGLTLATGYHKISSLCSVFMRNCFECTNAKQNHLKMRETWAVVSPRDLEVMRPSSGWYTYAMVSALSSCPVSVDGFKRSI